MHPIDQINVGARRLTEAGIQLALADRARQLAGAVTRILNDHVQGGDPLVVAFFRPLVAEKGSEVAPHDRGDEEVSVELGRIERGSMLEQLESQLLLEVLLVASCADGPSRVWGLVALAIRFERLLRDRVV